MVDIVTWRKKEFTFNGEKIFISIRPMLTSDVFSFMGFDRERPKAEHVKMVESILEQNTKDYENLTVDGEPATASHIAHMSIFMDLCNEIMDALTDISILKPADEKNLNRQLTLQKSENNKQS